MNTSCFECHITDLPQSFKLHLRGVNMNYEDGLLTIDMNKSGSGRGVKHIKIPEMNNMTLFSDTSSLELFINDGAYAFTTRIYNNSDTIEIISNKKIDMTAYQLKAIDLEPAKQAGSFLFQHFTKESANFQHSSVDFAKRVTIIVVVIDREVTKK